MFRRSTQPSPSPPCRSSLICVFICFFLSHFITLCLPDDVSLPPLRFIVIEEKCLQMFKQPNTDLHVHLAQYNTVSFSPLCKSLGVNRIFFFFFFFILSFVSPGTSKNFESFQFDPRSKSGGSWISSIWFLRARWSIFFFDRKKWEIFLFSFFFFFI